MNAITYKTVGDYQIPELTVPKQEVTLGKYGQMRRTYLKQNRPTLYSALLMTGKLLDHLQEIDKTATKQVEQTIAKMAEAEGVTEQLKADNPLHWTGLMNNFRHSAEELVLSQLVHN
ncbi:MAG: TnpV protein [Clostridia bacterium]|nr:TnpV protein [Clostridia bacterium]